MLNGCVHVLRIFIEQDKKGYYSVLYYTYLTNISFSELFHEWVIRIPKKEI